MRVSADELARWGVLLGELASTLCGGRALAVLEGGYDLEALGELVTGFVAELSGNGSGVGS